LQYADMRHKLEEEGGRREQRGGGSTLGEARGPWRYGG